MAAPFARLLASGPGWRASEIVCAAGPADRPFEERHESVCIAAVVEGTFQYRSTQGAGLLAPGALLLGNPGTCFECGHEHGTGDRCVAFHFAPDYLDEVLASVPGARRMTFGEPRLPPSPALIPLVAAADAARRDQDQGELEGLALAIAGAAVASAHGSARPARPPTRRDQARVSEVLRQIQARPQEKLPLSALARSVGMSPYHLLRTFRAVSA